MLNRHEKALLQQAQVWFQLSDIGSKELESFLRGWMQGETYCGGYVRIHVILAAYHDTAFDESLVA